MSTSVVRWVKTHPILFVAAAAAVARLGFALASFLFGETYLIPDEVQYVGLASYVARGDTAEDWFRGYGQSLYDNTWVFTAPLTFLFKLFGPSRIVGQLWAAGFGVACAALATRLTMYATRRWLAIAAGLVVALLPSQVLWSSVVLRESLIWAFLALVAVAVTYGARAEGWPAWASVGVATGALLALGYLRPQTLLAAAWVWPVAVVLAGGTRRFLRAGSAIVLALLVPLVAGLGLGGWNLVVRAVPALSATRTNFALDAESAFTPTTLLAGPTTTEPPTSGDAGDTGDPTDGSLGPPTPGGTGRPSGGQGRPDQAPGSGEGLPVSPEDSGHDDSGPGGAGDGQSEEDGTGSRVPSHIPEGPVVRGSDGSLYYADGSFGANLTQGVGGVVASTFRPWPWESADSIALKLAGLENLAWYLLYAFAAVGLIAGVRKMDVAAFPVLLVGAIIAIAGLTQGNLGTAFRHRGQILWCIAVMAALGVDWLLRRYFDARQVSADPSARP